MGFRFWRRIKVAPGVTLNLSKTSASMSFGPRGAKFTIGPHGRRTTIGATGTGLFYTKVHSSKKRGGSATRASSSSSSSSSSPQPSHSDTLNLGFFQKLAISSHEESLVSGLRDLTLGDESAALEHLEQSVHLADGAYLAGILSLNVNNLERAAEYLTFAAENSGDLGTYFDKYEVAAVMQLPITDEVFVHVDPDRRGVLLTLVEVYQRQERWGDASSCLKELLRIDPDDVVVRLSLSELMMDVEPDSLAASQGVVRLSEGVENETEIHAALMLYRGRALRQLGLLTPARNILTAALRRKKGRSEELLRYLRYERALVYEGLGQKSRSRAEFETLYVDAADFEDVAERLGLGL